MNDYVFILTQKGDRTNILSDFELISLERLIQYLKEDLETLEYNKDKGWKDQKKVHILGGWRFSIRVGKINDTTFQTRLLKYITLKEFEEIFVEHIRDIQPLLKYRTYGDKYFRMEVLKKYGIKEE